MPAVDGASGSVPARAAPANAEHMPSMQARVAAMLEDVSRLFWPATCLLCEQPGDAGRDLCAPCAATLPWNAVACPRCALPLPAPAMACGSCLGSPPPVALTCAAFVYGFPVDRLLPRLKFHQGLAAGRLLSQLASGVFVCAPRPDALVPIPLHRARLRERGYDQALELARPIARQLHLPLRDDLLRRNRATSPQSRLDAGARKRNLRDAFTVDIGAGGATPLPAHVALFDDVMTTGATLHAAARALRRAGVQRVDAWVCARVP